MKTYLAIVACLLCMNLSQAQNISLRGKVVDTDNNPIPFTNINIEGSRIGTATDMDGRFELNLPQGDYTIIASSMGYESTRVTVHLTTDSSKELLIRLTQSNEALSEIEVFGNRYEHPDKIEALTRLPLEPYNQIQSISI